MCKLLPIVCIIRRFGWNIEYFLFLIPRAKTKKTHNITPTPQNKTNTIKKTKINKHSRIKHSDWVLQVTDWRYCYWKKLSWCSLGWCSAFRGWCSSCGVCPLSGCMMDPFCSCMFLGIGWLISSFPFCCCFCIYIICFNLESAISNGCMHRYINMDFF